MFGSARRYAQPSAGDIHFGAPLIFIAALLEMFGENLQISVWGAVLAIPIFANEMTLAERLLGHRIQLIFNRFRLPLTTRNRVREPHHIVRLLYFSAADSLRHVWEGL